MDIRISFNFLKKVFSENPDTKSTFIRFIALLYLCTLLFNVINHEMWRDEIEPWLFVKSCSSISEIFGRLKYFGHPALWYVMLYPLSRLTDQPVAMQYYHLIFALLAIYVFIKFSNFERLYKILFIFGYFLLYEYATISRNYIFGILSIFLFCAFFEKRKKNYIILSLILFFLSQSSAFGLLLSVIFGIALFCEPLIDKDFKSSLSRRKIEIVISIIIVSFGIMSSYLEIRPTPDCYSAYEYDPTPKFDVKKILMTAGTIWKGFMPIPEISHSFWNTNILSSTALQAIFAFIILCFTLLLFIRKPIVLLLYSLGTISILAFTHLRLVGYLRHFGHLFLLFIACLWLSDYFTDRELRTRLFDRMSNFALKYKKLFITSILCAQLIGGVIASVMDWMYPFSESKNAAKFIKDNRMENMLIVGDIDFAAAPITAYLKKQFYYPRTERFGTFVIWDVNWLRTYQDKNFGFFKNIEFLREKRREDILLILNYDFGLKMPSFFKIKVFDDAIVSDENYYLYIWRYVK